VLLSYTSGGLHKIGDCLDIEYNLRFRYVKFTKCHNDILFYTLRLLGFDEYEKSIPPIHLFLELGASSKTMISLISMGISRTGASILANHAPRTNMDFAEVSNWIKRQNLSQLGLPKALISEVRNSIKI
jgi:hypothetical protein